MTQTPTLSLHGLFICFFYPLTGRSRGKKTTSADLGVVEKIPLLSGVVTCGEHPAPMSDDGSDSSSDAEEEKEANAAMAGYSMMMPQLSAEWAFGGICAGWFWMVHL